MDNIKNDHYYIQKLQQDLTFIVMHMRNVDIEELLLSLRRWDLIISLS
jgi:hypothetical protein